MASPCPKTATSRSTWILLIGSWFLLSIASRLLLKPHGLFGLTVGADSSLWLRAAVALLPLVPAILVGIAYIRDIRGGDELERRMHLEALTFAFPATLLLTMTLGLLDLVIDLNAEDWSYRHLWPYILLFWLFGYLHARQRYGIA